MRPINPFHLLAFLGALFLAGCCGIDSIRTEMLPDATLGQPYSFELQHDCSGRSSIEGAVWTLSGTLPPGISFFNEGRFSGTPTVTGAYSMTIQLSTSGDTNASHKEARSFTLTVRP